MSPHDEISFMKIHPEMQSSMKNVQKLVENIEAIHHQLAKTLHESQNAIMQTDTINKDLLIKDADMQLVDSQTKNKIDHTVSTTVENTVDKPASSNKTKSKPRIIKEERVNIKLNRFKMPHKSLATMTTVTPERNSWPPAKIPTQDINTIEELSKEILEQSKTNSTDIPAFKKIANYKNKDTSLNTRSDDTSSKQSSPSKSEGNNVTVQTTDINAKVNYNFVYILRNNEIKHF